MANLKIYEGENMDISVTVTKDGNAVNLTGGTLYFIAKSSVAATDASALLDLSSAQVAEIEVTDAAGGLATVKILPAHTGSLDTNGPVECVYELQLKDSGSKVYTLDTGRLTILPSARRASL